MKEIARTAGKGREMENGGLASKQTKKKKKLKSVLKTIKVANSQPGHAPHPTTLRRLHAPPAPCIPSILRPRGDFGHAAKIRKYCQYVSLCA